MAGTIVADTIQDGAGNSTSMDNAIYGSAKAWVNFAGATGTVSASYNVSSVTRTATGTYTVNFTTAMTDANYAVQFTFGVATISTAYAPVVITGSKVAGSCVVQTYLFDPVAGYVSIFR